MGSGGQTAQQSGCGGAHRRSARGVPDEPRADFSHPPRRHQAELDISAVAVRLRGQGRGARAGRRARHRQARIGTDLETRLRASGITTLVICGATTNHCVETTTRMAGNLGFDARLVRDATWTFDRIGPDGDTHSAEEIHAMTLSNLNGEFARIVTADDVISSLETS
jgi:hypothetical protein